MSYDVGELHNMGWNDKGSSVMVPEGYQLNLWQHPGKGGVGLEFAGSSECQDLTSDLYN